MTVTVAVFFVVYLGMMLGRLPGLKMDRAAIALLGAITLVASNEISEQQAVGFIGPDTISLLFGLMIVSSQFTLSGLYGEVTRRLVLLHVGPRALLALAVIWLAISLLYRNKWELPGVIQGDSVETYRFDRLESAKGLVITAAIVGIFLFTDWPRELVALAAGGFLLMNAHYRSRKMLDHVDWQLLILFISLFVVNGAFQQTHLPQLWVDSLQTHGIDFQHPATLFVTTFLLSDLVSNVPAVMLLLPYAKDMIAGPAMALAAGMASNLIIIGSIANIIVVEAAARYGVTITFREHARTGIPVTLLSLLIAAGWLSFVFVSRAS